MSKYKVKFYVSIGFGGCEIEEIIDLVEDYNLDEEEAEEIINSEKKLEKLYEEWMYNNIDTNYSIVESEDEE